MNYLKNIWSILNEVFDPEVPVLSIVDLGIVRQVEEIENKFIISITSTYTGCPAMDVIALDIKLKLAEHNYKNIEVKQLLQPAWTTDWMTEAGKQKLKEYGIAPPVKHFKVVPNSGIECPQCNSIQTNLISEFGSTACKALYKCESCLEPFDYFKCY